MESCLAIRYRDNIVVYLSLLEVCVDAHEFDVTGTVFDPTTVLEYLFQANAGITSGSDGTFSPLGGISIYFTSTLLSWSTYRRIDQLVPLSRIFVNLLNLASTGAL